MIAISPRPNRMRFVVLGYDWLPNAILEMTRVGKRSTLTAVMVLAIGALGYLAATENLSTQVGA